MFHEPDELVPAQGFIVERLLPDGLAHVDLGGTDLLEELVETRFAAGTGAGGELPHGLIEEKGCTNCRSGEGVPHHGGGDPSGLLMLCEECGEGDVVIGSGGELLGVDGRQCRGQINL